MDFIAIDFETANQYRTSACSLGIAVVKNNIIVETKEWLIKPTPFTFNYFNTYINGITENDVVNAPTFDELWSEISEYFDNKIVVAHNAAFDISVLRQTLIYYNIPLPNIDILCTYRISQGVFPDIGSYKLNVICELMNIPLNHHVANSDAAACAQILCNLFELNSLTTLKELETHFQVKHGFIRGNDYSPCRINLCKNSKKVSNISAIDCICIDEDFKDKNFVFTGTLLSMNRNKAFEIVTVGGGFPQKGITKNTNYLVVGIQEYSKLNGNEESTKMIKAKKMQNDGYSIQIISENDFVNMIDDELYKICFGFAK